MEDEVNLQPVTFVIEHIKRQISDRQILPGERLPSERKLSELLKVSRLHVREALQKMELYGIVKTYPQSGTVVSEFSKDQLDTMITDALKISKYDFNSLVYVRVLLEIEACKLCAINRTEEDLKNIEKALVELEEKFDTELRVEKDFAFHQAIALGGHNAVISSLLLIITPDILKYYQKYKVCAVPQKTVHAEHRELLEKIKNKDKDGMKELVLRHLSNLIDFARISVKENIPEFEYGNI
ncbi:FadR family transcriptional regulator [Bacteroidaceae bacterium HV4-6-C5C]|jgi:GntR family transcriptional repressor for pyruvate dehydrogenase complex|nr:FadR family transcriptional regulator [Bacteroidaceae bacterium HV4-6-C5C]